MAASKGSRVEINGFCNVRTGNKTKAYTERGAENPAPDITVPYPPKVLSSAEARRFAAALIEAADFADGISEPPAVTQARMIQATMRTYATAHGRHWKRDLRAAWMTGRYDAGDDSGTLQKFRNASWGGPAWLEKFKLEN